MESQESGGEVIEASETMIDEVSQVDNKKKNEVAEGM